MPNIDETTEKKALPYQFMSNMEEGFFWDRFDKNGFNNAYKPKKDSIDILLIGNSQMEAIQVASDKNTGYLLNNMIPDLYTYNIAIAGMFLKQNVSKLKKACDFYRPKKYVLLGIDKLFYDTSELTSIYDGSYDRKPNKNKKKPLIISYTWEKIKDRIIVWKYSSQKVFNKPFVLHTENNEIPQEYISVLDKLISYIRKQIPDNVRLIIFYYPTCSLKKDGSLTCVNPESKYIKLYEKLCLKNNIQFLDLSDAFYKLYSSKKLLPYGFLNTAPCVGHLNEFGHQAIAQFLSDKIIELEKGER